MSEIGMTANVVAAERKQRIRSRSSSWSSWQLAGPSALFFVIMLTTPLLMTFALSFYTFSYDRGIGTTLTASNYTQILTESYFRTIFGRTYGISIGVTVLCILLGAPEAYIISRMQAPWRSICLLATLGPLLISALVRTTGWVLLIGGNGLLSQALQAFGIVGAGGFSLVYTDTGIVIAMVHVMLPFMVVSVWASLKKLDPQAEQAAMSLGASKLTVLRRIVLPQVLPGILSGSLIVFALSASYFATPSMIGGRRLKVVATVIYDQFLSSMNWPLGAAIAIVLLVLNIILVMTYSRWVEGRYRRTLGAH